MLNKRAEIDNLKLKLYKLKLDVSDRDREISRLNSGIKEMSKYYSERCSKPYVNADMATNIKLDTAELDKSINELKDASHGTPHIRIDIPTINEYPRVYVDGKELAGNADRAIQKLLLNYSTGTAVSNSSQDIDVQYIEKDVKNDWSVKHYTESALDYKDDSELPKSHVNADMATDIKIDKPQIKIHELSDEDTPQKAYGNFQVVGYYVAITDVETLELLNKPNTRLAIIEEDTNA